MHVLNWDFYLIHFYLTISVSDKKSRINLISFLTQSKSEVNKKLSFCCYITQYELYFLYSNRI
jgi:hypothetical protein